MPQQFVFKPSYRLAWLICAGHAAAIGALFLVQLPVYAFALLTLVLIGSASYYLLRDAWRILGHSVTALRHERDRVVLFLRNGQEQEGSLLHSSVVTTFLVVLNISIPAAPPQHVVLMPDSLDQESFRRLRVLLKWGSQTIA